MTIHFQIGARTLMSVPRRLRRVELTLAEALAGAEPRLPPLGPDEHGYHVVSLPLPRMGALGRLSAPLILHVRQAYVRHFVDLAEGHEGWFASLSGNARSSLKRKAKRLAQANGGVLDIRCYRTAEDMALFQRLAREVSVRTYQEKLLDAGLPGDADFLGEMEALAGRDAVRAWLLFLGDRPIAYLYCPAEGDTLIYDRLGHDPEHGALSPGVVLLGEALRQSIAEGRFARWDFTSGEGQHKKSFASDGVPCVDLLLLKPSLPNRAVIAALDRFERTAAAAKRVFAAPVLRPLAQRLRRA